MNLSAVENAAAIVFDLKIDKTPSKAVSVGMDCGYPCRAEFEIGATLRKSPKKKWFSMPIPLNCFKSDDFDLSKISSPLSISTEGKMTLSIANIRIERLPEGEQGCAE
ncbi:putative glycoside hydrolase [Teredinibacter purpureus]|uniref:putative glycoside hydrolase n=1 Tax=Teredinibacter purpureus TaxID=2731756 RepID=UPI0013C42AC7